MGGFTRNAASLRRSIVSICTTCRYGIFAHHKAVWQTGECMGLVHAACAVDPNAQPVDVTRVAVGVIYPVAREPVI